MHPGAVVKDSQNPYRTGVLVGNHVEDRFGYELTQKEVRLLSSSTVVSTIFNQSVLQVF
jgi:hypothetical protein